MSKTILGLDLGTNSIGWALIKENENIIGMGSRIIPMSQDILGDFNKGNSISQTAERTKQRGVRRLRERHLLRRERLLRVLNVLELLPAHFSKHIDSFGKFNNGFEVKLPYSHFNPTTNKWDFIFQKAYKEMLGDFRLNQPDLFKLKANGEETKIPYDWTIYYLRKKALSQKLENDELAWVLLHFLQKRGYYQLRGEDEETKENKVEEFHNLLITNVEEADKAKREGEMWYNIHLENGWIYRRSSSVSLHEWKGKRRDFIVTYETNEDGSIKLDKDGNEKRSFRAPKDEDWGLMKKKTENELDLYMAQSPKNSLGSFIYDQLIQNPKLKIKGKLIRTVERRYYKSELTQILDFQIPLNEAFNHENYSSCIEALYESNLDFRNSIANNGFAYLFIDNIIFYQRPLKSKKSEISDCSLESRAFIDKDGILQTQKIKCLPKSNPLFQEFRLWQWIQNLKIYQKEKASESKVKYDVDITSDFIANAEDVTAFFDFLNEKREVKQDDVLKYFLKPLFPKLKAKDFANIVNQYRWNYVEDKAYPCNETRFQISARLAKVKDYPTSFLTLEKELELWHLLYSVTDKLQIEKALHSFALKNNLDIESFVTNFKKYPLIKSEYGAYSEKAIKKLLQLMRTGKYWGHSNIHPNTLERISKIITGEYDEKIRDRVREKAIDLTQVECFRGLPLWLASYVIYDRHAESGEIQKWNSPADLDEFLKNYSQHSLRNPIVEQVLLETLRVVNDIWKHPTFGNKEENYFSEIHIELGREMKNNAEDRKKIADNNLINENTNLRIRAILNELKSLGYENVIPYSPNQQEALKIYENGVIQSGVDLPDDILKISKSSQPNKSEIERYTLWLEQKYQSPYTGSIIPLSKLFTPAYEIEHIIPQSVYFDDSFSNKVICESEVNKLKDNQLGAAFIQNHGGEIVQLSGGKSAKIFTYAAYEDFVKNNYRNNRGKLSKLLLDDIPDKMIERQLNDTRYISKIVKNLLSNIVRESNEDAVTSKNIISCNGAITSALKQDWGLNDVWNELVMPRFERLNQMTNTNDFTAFNERHQKFLPTVPEHLRKGFQLKRIDHRHHAMDALVIACATRNHVNYLNNLSALGKDKTKEQKQVVRHDLKKQLCTKTTPDANGNYKWQFNKPWSSFTQDAKASLEQTIVSFKQNLRVINKTVNYYQKFVDGKKVSVKQDQGENRAIRKPMHKDTVYGRVNLPSLKLEKGKMFTASRSPLDISITEKDILKITDTGIQKILVAHLANYKGVFDDKGREIPANELAFSPEGLEEMNKNIHKLNNGKPHQPIYRVRFYEMGSRFAVGYEGNKKDKFVDAAKGTNLYFAIYQNLETKERSYATIPLNEVIERLKQKLSPVPEKEGCQLLFHLSPNDLVYLPNDDEVLDSITPESIKKLFVVNDFSGSTIYFTPITHAKCIAPKEVDMSYDGSKNKITGSYDNKTASFNKIQIKEHCIKINCNRLGIVLKVIKW